MTMPFLILTFWLCVSVVYAGDSRVEHDLHVEIIPDEHKLNGVDYMEIETRGRETLDFLLAERAGRVHVEVNGAPGEFTRQKKLLKVHLKQEDRRNRVRVTVRYSGIFNDPVPVRPLNTDNPGFGVSATISETGSFLSAGSRWYPELKESRALYNLSLSAPSGMIAVTAGRSLGSLTEKGRTVSKWKVDYPVEGLSLSVAAYILQEKKVGNVTAATYFLSPAPRLSRTYLDATARYLSFYSDLFGPYTFSKFAVVENFFPTGYGFPSYTLLGGTVLRLPFIIDTSLGHEIAHSWWGNGVFVEVDGGDWSEGLTTYVSDYLNREKKSEAAAREYRLQVLRNYSTLVNPQNDFELDRFTGRYDPVTQTIGYGKGAMVFHMLRKMIGERAFWGTLRDIYRRRLFKLTSWTDLRKAFEKGSNRSLKTFFDQWVHRKGAPRFSLEGAHVERSGGIWSITGHIKQKKPYFTFPLKLTLESGGQKLYKTIEVTAGDVTSFEMDSRHPPQRLILDKEVDIMRWLHAGEIPPSINSLKGSASVLFVISNIKDPALMEAARILALSLGLKNYQFVAEDRISVSRLRKEDLCIIGLPKRKELLRRLPGQLEIHHGAFSLNGRSYDGNSDVFFGVFVHPYAENRVAGLFWPLSPDEGQAVARKITHYGTYSYLLFHEGRNQDKGIWDIEESPMIYQWNGKKSTNPNPA